MLYLDTSAFLKLYIRESGSDWVQTQVASQDDPLPIWELQEAELLNALHLKVFWGEFGAEEVSEQIAYLKSRKKGGYTGFHIWKDPDSWIDFAPFQKGAWNWEPVRWTFCMWHVHVNWRRTHFFGLMTVR